jgi:ribosomal protein S18 acetylase RimI-like enzyme
MLDPSIAIRASVDPQELRICAHFMAGSEPWRTLGRTVEASLATLQNSTKEVYIAATAHELLGFLILDLTGPLPGYIQTICVAPQVRGQGLGARLVGFAETRIFQNSPNVFMCVSSFNVDARRLYERLGYEVVGVLKGYLVPEHDEILLRKSRGPWTGFTPEAAGFPNSPSGAA